MSRGVRREQLLKGGDSGAKVSALDVREGAVVGRSAAVLAARVRAWGGTFEAANSRGPACNTMQA